MAMAATTERPPTRRFTSDEVWRMLEVGILDPDEPYEFIDGEFVRKVTQNPPHAGIIGDLTTALVLAYGAEYRVRVQAPIGGIADSIPEPDLAVVPKPAHTGTRHPVASETLLVIEVSDTTLARDVRKGEIYATAGAPEYWLVDVGRRAVTVHGKPTQAGAWGVSRDVGVDGAIRLPGLEVDLPVADFLRGAGGG